MKDKLNPLTKAIISLALIAWAFSRVNLAEVGQMVASANVWHLLLALILYLSAISLNAVKWRILLQAQSIRVPLRVLLGYTFVGVFFNNFLPANVGGDVMRSYGLARYTARLADAAVSVIVDRVVGLIAYMSAAVVAALIVVNTVEGNHDLQIVEYVAFLALVTIVGGFGVLLSRRLRALAGRLFQSGWLAPLAPVYGRISDAFGAYRFRYGTLGLAFLVALGGLMLTNLVNWLLAEALGGGVPLIYICLFNPLIALVLLIPISIGGIGVNQNAYPFFFGLLGVPKGLALAMSLLMQAVIVVSSLPGGALWWRLRSSAAKAAPAPAPTSNLQPPTSNFQPPISIDQARTLYDGTDAAHAFDHVLRVLALAERIACAEGADLMVVRTAALLHDIERNSPDHHLRGAERARSVLAGWPAPFVEAVAHAIAAHRFRAGPAPETLEAQCLFDADKLDAMGAVGVARAFAYGGQQGQRLWAPLASIDPDGPELDPPDYTPVHEFVRKLARLPDRLYTATARQIAAERHAFMLTFYQRLEAEVEGRA